MTRATFLRGVWGGDSNDNFAEHLPVVFQPPQKLSPSCIANTFGETMIFDQITHFQVFKHHQIVRFDHAPCQFHGKVFTLARDFKVKSRSHVDFLVEIHYYTDLSVQCQPSFGIKGNLQPLFCNNLKRKL
jgi:hypothetical protein